MNNSDLFMTGKKYEKKGLLDKAYQYYLEAAMSEDDGEAMYILGDMYFEGDYVKQDYDKAGLYYGMAYEHHAKMRAWKLIIAGGYWERRPDNPENILKAIKYYEKAAEEGVDYGYDCLGKVYYELGDYDKSFCHLLLSDGRNPLGLYYLAKLYDEGLGVKENRERAIELYKRTVEVDAERMENYAEYGEDENCLRAKKRLKELDVEW